MKILHRFVLSAFVPPLAATFFIVMFVLILQFLWLYIDDLVGKGLDAGVVTELIFYAAINLVTMALPLSVLLSSIMVMGNLGEHNELMALKSAGISLPRIAVPVFVAVAMLTIASFVVANNIIPYTNLKFTSLLFSVKQQRPELQIKPGVFYDGIEGYVMKIDSKDEETGLLHGVMIYDHSDNSGRHALTIADSGYLRITSNQKYLIFTLFNGKVYEEMKDKSGSPKYPMRINTFGEQESIFELVGYGFERSDETLFKNKSSMMNLRQLTLITDSLMKNFNREMLLRISGIFHSHFFTRSQELDIPDSTFASRYKYGLTIDSMSRSVSSEQLAMSANRALQRAREAKSEIVTQVETLRSDVRQINNHRIEWHRKLVYAIACLLFFFVGAALGAIIRKGGIGTSFVISLLIFLIYYVILIICTKIAQDGIWNVRSALWVSSAVTAAIGCFFMYKAIRDRNFTMPQWFAVVASKLGKKNRHKHRHRQ
jgi:lipopolysaccharide export system permease protein